MLREPDIRKLIPKILNDLGGEASKKDVVDSIVRDKNIVLDPNDDLGISPSRPGEPKLNQRVGNITCHAQKKGLDYFEYDEGFAIIKNNDDDRKSGDWRFTLCDRNQLDMSSGNFSGTLLGRGRQKSSFKTRNVDWGAIDKKRKAIGDAGEEFVYKTEQEYVSKNFPGEEDRVEWVSRDKGDGCGYDVKSVCHDDVNKDLLIEVKSTATSTGKNPFQMSANELSRFEQPVAPDEVLELHRLYKPSNEHRDKLGYTEFKRDIYSQDDIMSDFEHNPITYNMVNKHK